jgi:hypothetical protein
VHWRVSNELRNGIGKRRQLHQGADLLGQRGARWSDLHEFSETPCGFLERLRIEGHRHPAPRSELVGQHRKRRTFDVLEQQCGAAGFDDTIGNFRDFEVWIYARGNGVQFAGGS